MDISSLFNPGVYKIVCLKNNKVYIGESANVLSRLGRHSDNLVNNRHDCFELQNDFNKYTKKNFAFLVLDLGAELKVEAKRKQREKKYIKEIKPAFRYNKKKNKTWNFYSQKVLIKGTIYESLRNAAICLNESRTNLMRKIKNENNIDYQLLEKICYKSFSKKPSIACQINNVNYSSLSEAAKALKQGFTTIKKKCESEKYPNFLFLNKSDRSNDYLERE